MNKLLLLLWRNRSDCTSIIPLPYLEETAGTDAPEGCTVHSSREMSFLGVGKNRIEALKIGKKNKVDTFNDIIKKVSTLFFSPIFVSLTR